VDRVARLEPHDALPAALREGRARLLGIEREIGEGRLGSLEHGDLAGQVLAGLAVQARHAGMGLLGGAEAELGLVPGVVGVDLGDVEHREQRAVLRRQRDAVALRGVGHRERHGQRPDGAVGELHLLDDARVVGLAHEAAQGRERAARHHVQVGDLALAQRDRLERLDAGGALADARDELAAVRRDQAGRHAATAAFTRPRCSR
jgi:hypothetical protein